MTYKSGGKGVGNKRQSGRIDNQRKRNKYSSLKN